jgi:2,3,4,5-tetrahydropyridine-2-carboxylate N-succinyltransferase
MGEQTLLTTGARGAGLATLSQRGEMLDAWFRAPELANTIDSSRTARLSAADLA